MFIRIGATAFIGAACLATLSAQATKPVGTKSVTHEVTITTTEDVYTGTMDMAIDAGKVTGKMRLTTPTEITGAVAGTAKGGALTLEFPFHMTENNCDGTVKMNITLVAMPAASTGTMEAVGCGRTQTDKVTGTVELKPPAQQSPAGRRGGGAPAR